MMYEEIQEHYPLEFAPRDQDKYRYRYPKGEVCWKTIFTFSYKGTSLNRRKLNVSALYSLMRILSSDWSQSLWSLNGRRMCWLFVTRLLCAVCLLTSWTRVQVCRWGHAMVNKIFAYCNIVIFNLSFALQKSCRTWNAPYTQSWSWLLWPMVRNSPILHI